MSGRLLGVDESESPTAAERSRAERYKDGESLRRSKSFGVFLRWIVLELVGFGVAYALASDQQPASCQGEAWCFSGRDALMFYGLVFGLIALLAQLLVGLALTAYFNGLKTSSFATGTLGFFTTIGGIALVFLVLATG